MTIGGEPDRRNPNLIGNIGGGFIPASGALRQFCAHGGSKHSRGRRLGRAEAGRQGRDEGGPAGARRILFRVMPIASWFGAEPKVSVYGTSTRRAPLAPSAALSRRSRSSAKSRTRPAASRFGDSRMNLRNPGKRVLPAGRRALEPRRAKTRLARVRRGSGVAQVQPVLLPTARLHDPAQTRGKAAVAHLKELMAEYGGKLPTEGRPEHAWVPRGVQAGDRRGPPENRRSGVESAGRGKVPKPLAPQNKRFGGARQGEFGSGYGTARCGGLRKRGAESFPHRIFASGTSIPHHVYMPKQNEEGAQDKDERAVEPRKRSERDGDSDKEERTRRPSWDRILQGKRSEQVRAGRG